MTDMYIVETDRLGFRKWRDDDAETLFRYASDPDVGPRAGWPPHKSVEESREIIRTLFGGDHMWALVLKETGEPIGCIGYFIHGESNIEIGVDDAEVGYWIGKPYWNQGICTEALRALVDYCFDVKGFSTLWGDFFIGNPASGHVMEKCGFIDTGRENKCSNLRVGKDNPVRIMRLDRPAPLTEEYLMGFVPERFLRDEKYRRGHMNILAPAAGTRILGMHTPEMKAVAKDLVKKGEWRRQLEVWKKHRPLTGAGGLTHEERMIWGLVLDYAKLPLEERLDEVRKFIPAVDNWAICDNFCCNAKWVEKSDKEKVWKFARELIGSSGEFRARVGLILSLAHFLDECSVQRTLDTVVERNFGDDSPFYIRMGAAWLFAEALCRQYDVALPFILERRLSRWINNKAIQKARESFRIAPELKDYLNTLKF